MMDTTINPIISQLKTEEENFASLGSKLEKTAQWMMEASGTPEFSDRQDVYYPLLNEWREQKAKVNTLYVQRAQRRLFKQANGFLSGR